MTNIGDQVFCGREAVPPNKPSDKTGLSTYIDCTKPEHVGKYISEMMIAIAN